MPSSLICTRRCWSSQPVVEAWLVRQLVTPDLPALTPSGVPHAFLNLTDDPGEIIVVYTPGGGHTFYEELGLLTRNGTPDRAAVFEKYDMTLLGPPLTHD